MGMKKKQSLIAYLYPKPEKEYRHNSEAWPEKLAKTTEHTEQERR